MSWWNTDWKYRKKITITETSGSNLTDYQVKITIDTASLVSAGKMKPDGSDIKFIGSDDSTILSYWIEEGTMNTSSTVIWIKVPSIPASSSTDIYMYYCDQTPMLFSITETSGSTLTDYQVKLPIALDNTSKYIIRRKGNTETLPWWSDGTNTWVKIPSLSANSTITLEVIFDDNGIVANGDDVFEFFDDFEGTSLDTNKWHIATSSGSYSVHDGVIEITSPTIDIYTQNYVVSSSGYVQEVRYKTSDSGSEKSFIAEFINCNLDGSSNSGDVAIYTYTGTIKYQNYDGSSYNDNSDGSMDTDWHTYKIEWTSGTNHFYKDNTEIGSISANNYNGNARLRLNAWQGSSAIYDWIRVRKYASSEPTVSQLTSADYVIIETSGSNLTDYQVSIPTSLDNSKKYQIWRDGETETLNWWSDGSNTWIKIPSLSANSSVILHIREDSSSGISSSGDDVFEFFDDFEDGSISDWTTGGTNSNVYIGVKNDNSLEGNYLTRIYTTGGVSNVAGVDRYMEKDVSSVLPTNWKVIFDYKEFGSVNHDTYVGMFESSGCGGNGVYFSGYDGSSMNSNFAGAVYDGSNRYYSNLISKDSSIHTIKISKIGNEYKFYVDSNLKATMSYSINSLSYIVFGIPNPNGQTLETGIGFIAIAKSISSEPTTSDLSTIGSDIDNTFLFGDDFDGSSLDTTKWDSNGASGLSVSGGYAEFSWSSSSTPPKIKAKTSFTPPFEIFYGIEFVKSGDVDGTDSNLGMCLANDPTTTSTYRIYHLTSGGDDYYVDNNGDGTYETYGGYVTTADNTLYTEGMKVTSSAVTFYRDSTTHTENYGFSTTLIPYFPHFVYDTSTDPKAGDVKLHFVAVKKLASSEPTPSVGSEEEYSSYTPHQHRGLFSFGRF